MAVLRTAGRDDHASVVGVIDQWWGRPLRTLVPALFLEHFADTSLIAEDDRGLAGFLIGFLSQTHPDEAYIHFAGVRPDLRGSGLGRDLYTEFFRRVRGRDRTVVTCITAPVNTGSIAFHAAMGFAVAMPVEGETHVRFRKEL